MSLSTAADLATRIRKLPAAAPLLADAGAPVGLYLVGGAVRDLLLGGIPTDLDLVYEGDPGELRALLGGRVVIHDRFGTATVSAGAYSYDIARSRSERYPAPGALPMVRPAPLKEDLRRRDFTVNAMAISLWPEALGTLHQVPRAKDDLEQRLLRVLHERSFADDPTRLLRMARYRARLCFEIESGTQELAAQALADDALRTVSGSRIGAELRLMAAEADPVGALSSLRELKLDAALHPRFGLRDPALAERALALVPAKARRDLLTLSAASIGMGSSELGELLGRLSFQATDRDRIVAAAAGADELARALGRARRPSEIATAVGGAEPEQVALAGALGAEQQAREWLGRLIEVRLEISGADLLAAGVPQGPAVGKGLAAALLAKLDGAAPDRAAELQIALASYQSGSP